MTFAHSAPAVNGWSRLPRSRTASPSSTVTTQLQPSGQSSGQAPITSTSRILGAVDLPPAARAVLSGPDFVARGIAGRERDPQRRWLLLRPRAVRRSFLAAVVDGGGDEQRWMLLQDDATRESYVADVLSGEEQPDRQAIWLLGQPLAVRESFVAEVLDAA